MTSSSMRAEDMEVSLLSRCDVLIGNAICPRRLSPSPSRVRGLAPIARHSCHTESQWMRDSKYFTCLR